MNSGTIEQTINSIRAAHPGNLMARHFNIEFFASLGQQKREHLLRIIASGMENPDSQMGAYAMHPNDYDVFATQLDPMIRDFHSIPPETEIVQKHDWDTTGNNCDLSSIDPRLKDTSMRVRVARNVITFPLPGAMDKQQRIDFEELAVQAFLQLIAHPDFGGSYLSITPGSAHEIDANEYGRRINAHQMFKDMSADKYLAVAGISGDWPYGRGMYVSKKEDFLVWVGEEDQLRIMAMQTGGNLNALFQRLSTGLEILGTILPPFAMSPTYGNVTSCPTNLGTGMRASLHLKLPNLTSNGTDLTQLKNLSGPLGLAVRGAGGEHSGAGADGLVDISPVARLGIREVEIMQSLFEGTKALWKAECA